MEVLSFKRWLFQGRPHPSPLPAEKASFESGAVPPTSTPWAPPAYSSDPCFPVDSVCVCVCVCWGEQASPHPGRTQFMECNLSSYGLLARFSTHERAPERSPLRTETGPGWSTSLPWAACPLLLQESSLVEHAVARAPCFCLGFGFLIFRTKGWV